jgi:hypothetical protein
MVSPALAGTTQYASPASPIGKQVVQQGPYVALAAAAAGDMEVKRSRSLISVSFRQGSRKMPMHLVSRL